MLLEVFRALQPGDKVRHRDDVSYFIVMANYEARVTVAQTVDITNLSEWDTRGRAVNVGSRVRSMLTGNEYIVTTVARGHATAARTADILEPSEWELVVVLAPCPRCNHTVTVATLPDGTRVVTCLICEIIFGVPEHAWNDYVRASIQKDWRQCTD